MPSRAHSVDPVVYQKLKEGFAKKHHMSSDSLMKSLNETFSSELSEIRARPNVSTKRPLISEKSIRNFFRDGSVRMLSLRNLDYLTIELTNFRNYTAASEALSRNSKGSYSVSESVYQELKQGYATKFGNSASTLVDSINHRFSDDLEKLRSNRNVSGQRDLISARTIYNFFRGDKLAPKARLRTLDYLTPVLTEFRNYGEAVAALDTTKAESKPQAQNPSSKQPPTPKGDKSDEVRRVIEFPAEYREAGTSVLSYFNHILNVKYPDQKVKVRIEQENLVLRMVIETPAGQRSAIEKTLEDYGGVVTGKISAEDFIEDPIEALALKNKLELAELELRQTRQLPSFSQKNHQSEQMRVLTLEGQVQRLFSIVEKGLQSSDRAFGAISTMTDPRTITQNFNSNVGNVAATNQGKQQTIQHNYAGTQSPATEAAELQSILERLSETYPANTPTEKALIAGKAIQTIDANPSLKARVSGALQAGSIETFKELIKHPVVNVFLALLEGWQDAE